MKIKYNNFLQLGAFIAAGHMVANTANKLISYTSFEPSEAASLTLLGGLFGAGILAYQLGKALNNLIINNLKKDADGNPIIDLNFEKFEPKKPKMR